MEDRVRVTVTDDLRRSRVTVFFRLILALPQLVWFAGWWALASLAAIVAWFSVIVAGRVPSEIHRFLAAYVRFTTHLFAYVFVAAEPWPGFFGRPGYPVDAEIPPPQRQSRLTGLFRGLLATPALILAWSLAGFQHAGWLYVVLVLYFFTSVASMTGFFAWWASLVLGRTPIGLRDLTTYSLGYMARTNAYVFLLTPTYPNSDPDLVEPRHVPQQPVSLVDRDDSRRSRLTVFFRLLLALPHLVWATLWGIAALLAAIVNWFATLILGRSPSRLHRFLVRYVRYAFHVSAFATLVANPFPGFVGEAGSYPVDLEIRAERRQHRLKTFFRSFLAIPAMVIASVLQHLLLIVAIFAWFAALITGQMPSGLQHLGAAVLRYSAQLWAYLFVLTDRYPHATPTVTQQPPPEAEAEPEPWPAPEPEPEPAY
jgi:hypothetical protein